jgi:general secretion pathway protein D
VKAGDTFTAQLTLQTDVPLFSAPMVLEFDPKVLQVVSVAEGAFLKDGGVATTFKPRIEPSGQVVIVANRDAAATTGASTAGTVATLVMRVLPTAGANLTQVQVLRFMPKVAGGQDLLVPPPAPLAVTVTR